MTQQESIINYKNNIYYTDIQYFGDIYFYFSLLKYSYINFYHERPHKKDDHANRMSIYGPNKILNLSVPLEGGRAVKCLFKDLKIASNEPWQRVHWRSIHDSYRKAPWFEEYAPQLSAIYQQNYKYLWDWNICTISMALEMLRIDCVIMADIGVEYPSISTLQEKARLKENALIYPPYNQVFADRLGFIPNLSIVDLLMNEGPAARDYIKNL